MGKEKIYLSSPHMGGEERKYIDEAFRENWIAPLGPNVNNFEKEISDYVGIKNAAALSSGTAAIHLALKLVGVTVGDKVFCSSLTFAASCNPIIYEGGEPVFIDSEPESWNMSPKALLKAFKDCEKEGKLPKAVIVVNLYGQSADMDEILAICNKYNVPIVEDAAESLGAKYKGDYSGTFGKFGIYSFNGNKIITTSGGGMLISNDEDAIKKARFWATQSREDRRYYHHLELGYNYRMSNIVAGIGRGQLKVLKERVNKKRAIFETYKNAFKDIEDIEMMPICSYGESNYWLTTITIKEGSKISPLDIIIALEKDNIESRNIWKPMHLQPYYSKYKFYSHLENGKSISEDIFNRGVCLPSDTKMTKEDIERVINVIKELFI
ncbi:aminotransferase class I/II-fold pyridoxal phosphate-dependent enzyme [Clostridium tertium]|uniref:DegT/DnrJ/EryC1/StrS family aminotransferase n=1 Tax=Clostridium tertium TaxID=1559 RepID=UPI0023306A54|nr:aminotransferase class I/II-fold pyridoxal phosphate-dependent enzyme [Clostridium tertium]MDB1921727.1 aminotransferase class I/II-fold pyridoxal phosphate-dependent enzyme [Clostridium tertium]MDB1924930.1 aminotransferase class I/II-fold pyridoxal phosphate-dependent enzyme [Clostridium tertium]MDB1929569.1 aminotransferase class I/II-fold pyridoxal phosphate-dependent enzyme [Clostridium tertium]